MTGDANWNELRDKIIGLGDQSARKSYFPELQKKIHELEDREKNLQTLLDSMMDAFFLLDGTGAIIETNSRVLKMFQIPDKATVLTFRFTGFIQNIADELMMQIISETLAGMPQIMDWKVQSPVSGNSFEAEVSFHATTWDKLPVIIATIRDVSFRKMVEQRLKEREQMLIQKNKQLTALNQELAQSNQRIAEMNEQLRKARKKAVESDRLKSAFLANMSHEIRTPMNGIVGFASLLAYSNGDKEVLDESVTIINNCSAQLLRIIDDIIDISKIEARQITLSPQMVPVNCLLQELFAYYKVAAKTDVELVLKLALPDDQSMVYTDPMRLRQVLTNLINNALKFTEKGQITIGYHCTDNRMDFFVSDTGIGISPQNQSLIFKRFMQAENKSSVIHGGTGLGLAISKALVRMLGGKISVKSQPGQGATFHFTIPFVREIPVSK